jgi:hypothetical protein
MKTKITIYTILLGIIAVVMFFSCDNPVFLGTSLDIQGPVVEIVSPTQRQSVPVEFDLEGTVWDNSSVEKMIIKAVNENTEFPRQWRYQRNTWEVSSNYGATWSPLANAVWTADANNIITWKIHVDMWITGQLVKEGEYTFNVQAWDKGGFSDDNSIKAVVLIVDLSPPKVDISYPFIYRGKKAYESSPLLELHTIPDTGSDGVIPKEYEDPAFLGKFLTQEFELKWQIEDINDVWSIDLRFYNYNEDIDDDISTPLPQNYIYMFSQNMPPVPVNVNPADYIKPNGSVIIPDLTAPAGIYDQGGQIKNPITEKTTLKAVAVCYDAAGNPNQEKTLGYFVYWPRANKPWIAFPDEMKEAGFYYGKDVADFEENDVLTVFPSKYIKSTAYQAHGVKKIEYELYSAAVDGVTEIFKGTLTNKLTLMPAFSGTMTNAEYSPGMYTNIVTWQLNVPPLTGYYVIKAVAFSNKDKPSEKYEMLFRVNDITFPDFTEPVKPDASAPLFMAIDNKNQITISGLVGDVNEIETLCLVWINPKSDRYKAMSQLAYFREKNYPGWQEALTLGAGKSKIEEENHAVYGEGYPYDKNQPNRLWKLDFKKHDTPRYPGDKPPPDGIDPDTHRRIYSFSQIINLSELNIGMGEGKEPLSSQIFMIRAENPAKRCTIITYAPQGDTLGPEISIKNVVIKRGDIIQTTCIPNQWSLIPIFALGDTIQINGKWKEDSMANDALDINTYFKNIFEITVNNKDMLHKINQPSLTLVKGDPDYVENPSDPTRGTWTLTTSVGTGAGMVPLDQLKDNLVIDAKTSDIGGNEATLTNSWIIESDHLVLNRISSEQADGTYVSGNIIIFLEFNKPVNLANGITGNLDLILSTDGTTTGYARYQPSSDQNSRQRFLYTVAAGQNTVTPEFLNVTGLRYTTTAGVVTNYTTTTPYNTANYPFRWTRGGLPTDSGYEEVRITTMPNKSGGTPTETVNASSSKGYYVRTLPTSGVSALISSKHIKIDTAAPTITGISSDSPQRYYSAGEIYIKVTFNEAVKLGSGVPRLSLRVGTQTIQTTSSASDITVNNNTVTFKYNIEGGQTSNGTVISVTGYSGAGAITDIAGNVLPENAVTSYSGTKTLAGIYVETQRPEPPKVRLFSTQLNGQTTSANVISQIISPDGLEANATTNYGDSTLSARNLVTVYNDNDLWLSIEGTGAAYKYEAMEYSLDGSNWQRAPNTANNSFRVTKTPGNYTITARQIDSAGNVGTSSPAITFTWDPGDIITRVSSDNANGTYTHNSDIINITVYFRKPIYFTSGTPQISIDAKRNSSNIPLTATTNAATSYTSLTFPYRILNGDTSGGANINIASTVITGAIAHDKTGAGVDRVRITSLLTLPTTAPNKFDKEFKVATGNLSQTPNPSFVLAGASGTSNDESNENFHGIRKDDGSYWTTLVIPFDRNINKGAGLITVTQIAGTGTTSYRLPAVMTEAQYNRFRNVSNINDYYTKGTNGYINGTGSDTSAKYILKYKFDPNSSVTNQDQHFTDNTPIPSTFFNEFRAAEAVSVNVNAQAVTINGQNLRIRLTGSGAPQVPGATYTVSWEEGIVTDDLGNSITSGSKDVVLGGVAKPFIRIKKTQDTIKAVTGSAAAPRLEATQPLLAYARMDCRTPGSAITYRATDNRTALTGNAPGTAGTNNNWPQTGTWVQADTNNTDSDYTNRNSTIIATNNNTVMLISRPANPNTGTPTSYSETTATKQLTLGNESNGNSPTLTNVQGYQWWVWARATATVGGTAFNTDDRASEEVAYRTVISYSLRNANAAITGASTAGYAVMENGDQIWIRGGDAIGTSSIPGFPFTWEDDFAGLEKKRAGIRLMSLVGVSGNTLNNSLWRLVTWDMNTTAYIDFIKGHDLNDGAAYPESSEEVAWQYGPKRLAYQRDGWTSLKESYPVYAGKHRWCDAGYGRPGSRGAINFSATFMSRPTFASSNPLPGTWLEVNKP